uniref:Piwi domain-containing protein n=1 Tax=Ditylenchus dipsaci TaxID=166011 RepID=A0A915DK33_9BILA
MSIVHENKIKTLENIINKSNMKLNGLNYVPLIPKNSSKYSLESGKILVIGLDVAHPKHFAAANEVADPSVVGICANMVENKHNFVGDYFFQTARQESIDKQQLKQRIHWILRSLQKNRPDTCPQLVVVLRDGLSEGQFKMAIQDELAAIKEACQEMRLKNLKFVLLIATKRHSKRIFALQNGIKNVAPGSVVEEKYVREDVVEWFQLPHKAIKGTAQAVQYALLVNELNIPTSDLQAFLTTQCFNHQIVTSAVSLPEPVFQADELAKRGYNNFETMRRLEPGLIPIENKKEGAKEEKRKQQQVDVEALSLLLSYKDSKLEGTRFTA